MKLKDIDFWYSKKKRKKACKHIKKCPFINNSVESLSEMLDICRSCGAHKTGFIKLNKAKEWWKNKLK
jgi:hypothetical protein